LKTDLKYTQVEQTLVLKLQLLGKINVKKLIAISFLAIFSISNASACDSWAFEDETTIATMTGLEKPIGWSFS
jgi:hypothetical protein